jgi:hypothetical protein
MTGHSLVVRGGVVLAIGATGASGQLVFSEQAATVGITHSHATVLNGPDMEFYSAGGAVGDFDRDGDLDIFMIGGSAGADKLYINDGTAQFTNQAVAWGVARSHRGSGAAVGDYDRDGDLDIYVTSIGTNIQQQQGTNILYRNNGNGTFTDVSLTAGVRLTNATTGDAYGASFGDYDLDGDLDLAVAGWLGGNRLFRNNGNGTFTNVTATALPAGMDTVRGYSVRFTDMNGDRYPELLWIGDFFTTRYLVNNGDGTFADQTASAGVGLESNGMGVAVGDVNNDGLLDWYVTSRRNEAQTNGSGNMLYLQGVPHAYNEVSMVSGVNFGSWGWGTDAADFDHDGDSDIVATNGFDTVFVNDPTFLFANNNDGTFSEAAVASGINDTRQGRGLLTADIDRDGDRDIMIFNSRQPVSYFRNDTANAGNAISLSFVTRPVSGLAPDGFGTRVVLDTGGTLQARIIDGGTNYLAQSELSAHFGLGSAPWGTATVCYADGLVDTFPNVRPGRWTIERLNCPVDFRQDGALNFFDVSDFLAKYGTQHPMADFNRDGSFNFFDVSGFLAGYNAGCP